MARARTLFPDWPDCASIEVVHDGRVIDRSRPSLAQAPPAAGLVAATVTNSGGGVNPGDTIGTLRTLVYAQGAGAALDIGLGSATPYDALDVAGAAALYDYLEAVLVQGFKRTLGESFAFQDYQSHVGEFADIEDDFIDGEQLVGRVLHAIDAAPTGSTVSGHPAVPELWLLMPLGAGGIDVVARQGKRRRCISARFTQASQAAGPALPGLPRRSLSLRLGR